MNPVAIAMAGIPPHGVGIYARDYHTVQDLQRWDIVVLQGRSVGVQAKVQALKSPLRSVWLYVGVALSQPDTWEENLAILVDRAKAWGCAGVMLDPETGWTGSNASSQAARMGRALKAASAQTRVGFTSYPAWAHLDTVARECKGSVFGSPQNYPLVEAPTQKAWFGRWQNALGARSCILSVGAYPERELPPYIAPDTPEKFDAYLASLPKSTGALAWTTSRGPEWMMTKLRAWKPAGPFGLALVARDFAFSRVGLAIGGFLLILVLLAALGVLKVAQ